MNGRPAWLLLCLASLAAAPAGRPLAPLAPLARVDPRDSPPLIDRRRPAFVPSFAKVDNPPAGRFAERQYTARFTYPGPYLYGYGGYGWINGYSGIGRAGSVFSVFGGW